MHLSGSMKINHEGHLDIGDVDTTKLVKDFGTPLYVMDEEALRNNCRVFRDAFAEWGDSLVIYASKTLSCLSLCAIIKQEGLGLDVVSGGELHTALQAGFPREKIYFHGNNKSKDEMMMAVKAGVGKIVVDNFYEMELLNGVCAELDKSQDIMLRITPGIEAHTHKYIKTGQIDSKFGFTLSNGQAMQAVKAALTTFNLNLTGLHCHIGSQIFAMDSFSHAAGVMMDFMAEVKGAAGQEFDELNVGGGMGIYYYQGDEPRDPREWARAVMMTVADKAREKGLKMPRVIVEPGRAIAGPAGITLYSIGSIKEISGVRKYATINGGMTDNPRPILYEAKYEAILANKANQPPVEKVSIAGRCCESGDMLIWDIVLPEVESGDILAVFATGAYNYSMASNYNKFPRPAMVLVNQGSADIIIKRESYDDIIRNEVLLDRLT